MNIFIPPIKTVNAFTGFSYLGSVVQGRNHWGSQGWGIPPPIPSLTSVSELNKVQKFEFQISGILFFTDAQKLYGSEILQFLPCVLQFLDNLWWPFSISNCIGEIDHFTLDLLKRSDT